MIAEKTPPVFPYIPHNCCLLWNGIYRYDPALPGRRAGRGLARPGHPRGRARQPEGGVGRIMGGGPRPPEEPHAMTEPAPLPAIEILLERGPGQAGSILLRFLLVLALAEIEELGVAAMRADIQRGVEVAAVELAGPVAVDDDPGARRSSGCWSRCTGRARAGAIRSMYGMRGGWRSGYGRRRAFGWGRGWRFEFGDWGWGSARAVRLPSVAKI